MKKIVICGGHLTPAKALIEEIKKSKNGTKIYFFGRKYSTEGSKNYSAEYKLTEDENITFTPITSGRFQRKFTKYTIISLFKVPVGLMQSFYHLLKIKPQVVVSFGGYVALPVVIVASLLRIKVVIHEQSSVLGLTNRIASFTADRIFLTFENTQKIKKGKKTQVIGNLLRKSIFAKSAEDEKLKKFLDSSDSIIFITGGNQGSHFINNLIFQNIDKLEKYKIIHQVGLANYKGDFENAKLIKNKNYFPIDYIHDEDIGAIFNKAKIIISRSGANTVWEIASLAKPAILIPLPISASGEQSKNAQLLKDAKSAIVLNQKEADFNAIYNAISKIENSYSIYEQNAQKLQHTLPQNSASILARHLLSYT